MLFWGHVLARWHANLRPNCAPLPPPRLPGQPGATAGWALTAAPSPATPTPRLSRKGLESGITGWLQRPKVTQGFLSAPGNFLLPNPTPACPAPSPSHPFPDAPAAAQATFPRGTPQLPTPCPTGQGCLGAGTAVGEAGQGFQKTLQHFWGRGHPESFSL